MEVEGANCKVPWVPRLCRQTNIRYLVIRRSIEVLSFPRLLINYSLSLWLCSQSVFHHLSISSKWVRTFILKVDQMFLVFICISQYKSVIILFISIFLSYRSSFLFCFLYRYSKWPHIDRTIWIIYQLFNDNSSFSIWFDKSAGAW